MTKFPSIEQFRHAIKRVRDRATFAGIVDGEPTHNPLAALPTLRYRGTVKLHGTNAAVVWHSGLGGTDFDKFTYQSRERELSLTSDNAGFYAFAAGKTEQWTSLVATILAVTSDDVPTEVAIFGEWCGEGIQKGVGISSLPKMFVIFAVSVDGVWQNMALFGDLSFPEHRIYNVMQFPVWELNINFATPELIQNELITLTQCVEDVCPVTKVLNGKEDVGEGIVWTPVDTVFWNDPAFWFKVKGEKHSVSKVKTLAPVDTEAVANAAAFVDRVVTEARLEQGLDNLVREQQKPFEMTSLTHFLRWVMGDVAKEEHDTIISSGLDIKKINTAIATRAKVWFITKLNNTPVTA